MQNFSMSDIGDKMPTKRTAIATGRITVNEETFELIKNKQLKKGDALTLAEIAGIQAAKKASDMILLCHPIIIDHIKVTMQLEEESNTVIAYGLVSTIAKTGVEMEAIAAVNGALITVYDLAKMYDPAPLISDIRLLMKQGGKKGLWFNPNGVPDFVRDMFKQEESLSDVKAAIITMSDRAASGTYEDESGKVINDVLGSAKVKIIDYKIIKDDKELIIKTIKDLYSKTPQLIITTGGTGISGRDVTPDALKEICCRFIPGIGELLRINGAKFTKHSWSSRSTAGIIGKTLVISLAGSPKAVKESLDCLMPLIPHLLNTIKGKKHD